MGTVPTSVMNASILEAIARDDMVKVAEAASEVTRTQIREDSFLFKILTPKQIQPSDLDRDLDDTHNRVIIELEPDGPGAKWAPLQDVPEGEYIRASRYAIPFARVLTPKHVKDIAELYTVRSDIRKMLVDNSIKDGLTTIDSKWIEFCTSIVEDCAGPGSAHNFTGKVQWRKFSGGITRENLVESMSMLTKGNAQGKFRLKNNIMLMNDYTAQQVLKFKHDEVGGPAAQDMFFNGLTTDKLFGLKALYTIKDDLVPDNTIWFYTAPEFLGHCFYLDDWTMYMKKEAYFISMFSYWYGGFGIGNVAGVCKAEFVD